MDVFLIGVPKAGTTWLSNVLDQHPGVVLSEPKEPNFVASHKGTFERDESEPDWSKYGDFFSGDGLKMDASVQKPMPQHLPGYGQRFSRKALSPLGPPPL